MANMNIGTPRFYTDQISYLMSRGLAVSGNFDAISGANLFTTINSGSVAEMVDMRPLNKVVIDTGGKGITQGFLLNVDTQSTSSKKSFVAILNHNCKSANARFRIAASNTESHVNVVNFNSPTLSPDCTNVVNGSAATEVITPAVDGSTIITFAESSLQYWGIQFEGATTFSGTDLFVGCIMIGEYYEMPHSPDLDITRMISYNRMNDLQESYGGQRFSNLKSYGRTAGSTSKSPFTTASNGYDMYGGRIIYDMKFSFVNNTDLMPDEYHVISDDDNFITDVWNKTNGNHLPFIMSIDKSSEGANAESEHIFARFANNSLDMTQAAPSVFNIKLTVEEEF